MLPDEQESQEKGKEVSRRDFLKYAGITGAAVGLSGGLGGLLAACGGGETTTSAAPTTTAAGPTTTAAGPTTTAAETTTTAAGPTPPSADKIKIGAARPISGVNAIFEQAHFGPAYHLWVKDLNDAGGLEIAGKKLPIELTVYDDQSDLDTSMRLLTKLMEEDKMDFVFAPCSTAFLFAAAGLVNAHNYIFLSAEGGATTLSKQMEKGDLPWVFQFLNYSDHNQMPEMAAIMSELGMTSVAIMYIDDLHGIEYNGQAQVFMGTPPLNAKITSSTAVPPGIKDVSSILKKIQQENPDLICSFQYPPENILTYQTLMQLNYNPKALLGGPGTSTQAIYDIFKGGLDGCFFEGAWTPKQTPAIQDYYSNKLVPFVQGPANVDFWGALIYRAELEFFQQAIQEAATLDQAKVAEVMRKAHYKTIMSDDTFMNPIQILDNSCYAGQIGQWQNGYPEVADKEKRTTDKLWYPKPNWADAPAIGTSSTT